MKKHKGESTGHLEVAINVQQMGMGGINGYSPNHRHTLVFVRIWVQKLSTIGGGERLIGQKTSEIFSLAGLHRFREVVCLFALASKVPSPRKSQLWIRVKYVKFVSFIPVHRPGNFKVDFLRAECLLMVFPSFS